MKLLVFGLSLVMKLRPFKMLACSDLFTLHALGGLGQAYFFMAFIAFIAAMAFIARMAAFFFITRMAFIAGAAAFIAFIDRMAAFFFITRMAFIAAIAACAAFMAFIAPH